MYHLMHSKGFIWAGPLSEFGLVSVHCCIYFRRCFPSDVFLSLFVLQVLADTHGNYVSAAVVLASAFVIVQLSWHIVPAS